MKRKLKIRTWLKKLPKEVEDKAKGNIIKCGLHGTMTYSRVLNMTKLTLGHAISAAFIWSATKEGHRYWADLAIKNGWNN